MSTEGETPREQTPPPYPLAMVVCDAVHRDPGTGKAFILGCFSVIHARDFPATHPLMCLYVSMTDGRGNVPVKVVLTDADEAREAVWEEESEIEFNDPRVVVDMIMVLGGVTFPEPGEYRFQLFASGEFLMERRILVLSVPQGDTNESNEH